MSEYSNIDPQIHQLITANPVVAVMVCDDPNAAVSAAEALHRGGVRAVELALRTTHALDCAQAIVERVPDLLVIAGTVLTLKQLDRLAEIGVRAAVAPGMNRRVVEHARSIGMSFAPGVCTPSDIEAAVESGCRVLKFFPAEPSGGLPMLTSMAGPYRHLGIEFIPLGGIRQGDLPMYLGSDLTLAIGGSWICPGELIDTHSWEEIESRAKRATRVARRSGRR